MVKIKTKAQAKREVKILRKMTKAVLSGAKKTSDVELKRKSIKVANKAIDRIYELHEEFNF